MGISNQRIEIGQVVIDPLPSESHSQDQRCIDITEAFFEVGAILLRDVMQAVMWQRRARVIT